jgi:predicted DNA-binding transcriptional regulator AlpA
MTPAPHIISAIKALMAGYPDAHTARVVDALKRGPRIKPVELARECHVSRRTVWRWVQSGAIPKPMERGKFLRFWDYSQVAHLMNAGGRND